MHFKCLINAPFKNNPNLKKNKFLSLSSKEICKDMKNNISKLIDKLTKKSKTQKIQITDIAVELEEVDVELIRLILDKKYTMTSPQRLINTLKSCQYVIENNVPGDFVECGVFRGFKSFFLLSYLEDKLSDRSYFLFDTFEGIDTLQAVGSPVTKKEHEKSRLFEFVKHRFSKFDNVILIKGSVPDSLKKTRIKKVKF